MIELTHMVLFGVLLWASIHDLIKHTVPDYVFIVGTVGLLIASVFSSGLSPLLGMGKTAILMLIVGIIINLAYHFGMADVFALGLIGLAFPGTPIRISLAITFFVMWIWMKFYSFITRKKKVPAIPGILLGAIALLSYTI